MKGKKPMADISANEALENAIMWAYIEMLSETKKANNNNDNMIMRELKGLHQNTTKGDLPPHLKQALRSVNKSAMGYLNSKGYKIVPIER